METDVSVPGFPAMAEYFNTTVASIQSTLSLNLLGFCISAIFFGPLADCYGRKKVMLSGFAIFAFCSLGCVLTNDLTTLLIFRFFQGLGGSSLWVIAYAIVADIYEGPKAIRFISVLNAVVTAAMAVAPAFGALLCASFGWQSTYTFIAILSIVGLIMFMLLVPETSTQQEPLNIRKTLGNFRTLLGSYDFMLHVLTPSFLCVPYMAYIACASFLYIRELNMSYSDYALHQSIVIATFSLLSFKSDWAFRKFGEVNTQKVGLILTIGSMILFVPLVKLYPTSAAAITCCMTALAAGIALVFGLTVGRSMGFFPNLKATASSLMMAIRVSLCSLGVIASAALYDGTLLTSAITIAVISIPGILTAIMTYRYSLQITEQAVEQTA